MQLLHSAVQAEITHIRDEDGGEAKRRQIKSRAMKCKSGELKREMR
jgi:hypothetical protein